MSTKDYCFLFKDKQDLTFKDNLTGEYKNLNLNQNNQCSADIIQSKTLQNNNKISNYEYFERTAVLSGLLDYSHNNDSQTTQNSTSFGKTKLSSSFANLNVQNNYGKKEKPKEGKTLNANSSTLSLHITAYENSIEANSGDTINGEKDETNKKKGNTSSIKNWKAVKEILNDSSVKYAFELPRQQQDENSDPEVMQFKASQRLSNVNQPHPAVIGPSSAATNTVSQQPPPAIVNPAPSSSNSQAINLSDLTPDNPTTSSNNNFSTSQQTPTDRKKRKAQEEQNENGDADRSKVKRKCSYPDWKPLFDEMNVSEDKQKVAEPLLVHISSKMSKEIVAKHFQDQTRNKCIIVKLGQRVSANFNTVIKAARCPDNIYQPDGHFKYTKTCNTVDCVQLNHWNVSLIYQNAAKRNSKRRTNTKAYKDITEEDTEQVMNYLLNGLNQQQLDEVRENAKEIANEILVVFKLGAEQTIQNLSSNECSHNEGYEAIITKQKITLRKCIWFLNHPLKKVGKLDLQKLVQPCTTNDENKICMSLSHYRFFDDGRIFMDVAPIVPSNPHPSELQIRIANHGLSDEHILAPNVPSNSNTSENQITVSTPGLSNEHILAPNVTSNSDPSENQITVSTPGLSNEHILAPNVPSISDPSENQITVSTPGLSNEHILAPNVPSISDPSENQITVSTPGLSNERVGDIDNANSMLNEVCYEDYSDVGDMSIEQIEKRIEKDCEEIEKKYEEIGENGIVEMEYEKYHAKYIQPLLEKISKEKMPVEFENHKDEFIELIRGMINGGVRTERIKKNADWKNLLERAKSIVREKAPNLHSENFEHFYTQTCNQIEVYVAFMLHFREFSPVVQNYQELEGITKNDEEDIQLFINQLSESLISQYISQISNKGFSQLLEVWCYGIKDNTRLESGYVFLDYLSYNLAHNTLPFDQFWKQFLTCEFNDKMIPQYQEFLLSTKPRAYQLMQSTENFLRGKKNQSTVKFDPCEMYKVSIGLILSSTIALGVACKYVGIYSKTKDGFRLGTIKENKALKTRLVKNRITLKRDIWPLQWRDMILYYNKCQTNSMWDVVSKTFTITAAATGWRPSSLLCIKRHTLAQEFPGIRLKNIRFGYVEGLLKYEMDAVHQKIETTAAEKVTHVEVCNGRKHCPVHHLVRDLAHRGVFKEPIHVTLCNKVAEDLQISPEHANEYLFPFVDMYGIVHPNTPMPLSHVEFILDDISMKLKVPRNLITCKAWRKAKAIEGCLDIMKLPGSLPTIKQMTELLESTKNWKSDNCLTYTDFGDDELGKCLKLCTSIKKNKDIDEFDPEKLISHISDLATEESIFFTSDSPMVVEIVEVLKPIWFSSEVDSRVVMGRRKNLASMFNSFGANYRPRSTKACSIDILNPATELDFNTVFECYPYSMTNGADISLTCPHCSIELEQGSIKKHLDEHGNIPFSCCDSYYPATKNNLYQSLLDHHQKVHRYKYICRSCNIISNWNKIRSCLRAENPLHNVSCLGMVHDHWLPESIKDEDETKETPPRPPAIVINFSKEQKDKEMALKSLKPFMQHHFVIVGKIQTWIEEDTIDTNVVNEILNEPGFSVVKAMLQELGIIELS